MSARVFNPLIMSEMRRVMRGGGHLDLGESETRSPRDNGSLERIKKCLFGPMDHTECKLYVQQELDSHREKASDRWNFDFKTGKPRPPSDGEGSLYEWKTVKASETVPEAYALSRLPYLSQHADSGGIGVIAAAATTTATAAAEDTTLNCPSSSSSSSGSSITSGTRPVKCNKQTIITDFMRKQKTMNRIQPILKSESLSSLKSAEEEPPKKKARACSS